MILSVTLILHIATMYFTVIVLTPISYETLDALVVDEL